MKTIGFDLFSFYECVAYVLFWRPRRLVCCCNQRQKTKKVKQLSTKLTKETYFFKLVRVRQKYNLDRVRVATSTLSNFSWAVYVLKKVSLCILFTAFQEWAFCTRSRWRNRQTCSHFCLHSRSTSGSTWPRLTSEFRFSCLYWQGTVLLLSVIFRLYLICFANDPIWFVKDR